MRTYLSTLVLVAACVVLLPPVDVCASTRKGTAQKKKSRSTTTLPKKVRFVWMCSLMERMDLNIIPGQTPASPITNFYQKGGNRSDWRTEDKRAAAKTSGSECSTFFLDGTKDSITTVQVFKKTESFFSEAPKWDPKFKWVPTQIDGLPQRTFSRRTGRYVVADGRPVSPGCQVGVETPRGVFYIVWSQNYGDETDVTKVSCDIPAEAMRRTLAALEAGGYEYLN
jgi:hypothetical protein